MRVALFFYRWFGLRERCVSAGRVVPTIVRIYAIGYAGEGVEHARHETQWGGGRGAGYVMTPGLREKKRARARNGIKKKVRKNISKVRLVHRGAADAGGWFVAKATNITASDVD